MTELALYARLYWEFFKTGLFAVGGAFHLISCMRKYRYERLPELALVVCQKNLHGCPFSYPDPIVSRPHSASAPQGPSFGSL